MIISRFACAKSIVLAPFTNIKIDFYSEQYNGQRNVAVSFKDFEVESIATSSNFAGNLQKNYSYRANLTIPFFKFVKRIYFYQEGLWDDLGFVEVNDVYRTGVSATILTGRKSGWYEYTSDQVQEIISKSSGNTVKVAIGVNDIYGARSDACGTTVIYFSYK